MRSFIPLIVIMAFCFGVCEPGSAQTTQPAPSSRPALSGKLGSPIQVFNGKDLAGWSWFTPPGANAVKMEEAWSVKDGILHCKGKPSGYLSSDRQFENFILTVEQRHVAKGNGGIFFAISGPDKLWPKSFEVQTQTGDEGDIRGISNWKFTADPQRIETGRIRKIGPASEKPPGEWETVEVIVDSGSFTVFVNGQLQNQGSTAEPLVGKIGLQSEGGEMEFRKVELTPIEK